jgi:hypothetical protein
MIRRCTNKNTKRYKHYGGRGIEVCKRWRDFANFFADMGHRPSSKHSIDRINNNGNYEPSNCRWATSVQQHANQRHLGGSKKGQVAGELNPMATLSEMQVIDIKKSFPYTSKRGPRSKDDMRKIQLLCQKYNIPIQLAQRISSGKRWGHITIP